MSILRLKISGVERKNSHIKHRKNFFLVSHWMAFLHYPYIALFKKIITKHHQTYWNKTKYAFCLSYKTNSTNEEYEIPIGSQSKQTVNRNTKGIETSSIVNVSFNIALFYG